MGNNFGKGNHLQLCCKNNLQLSNTISIIDKNSPMDKNAASLMQFLLVIVFIIPAIFFLLTQYRTLRLVRPENRRMPPGQVWLQMIPLFGLVWQYYVVRKISDSIRLELSSPAGDSIFSDDVLNMEERPTYNVGMGYATAMVITILPVMIFNGIAALVGIILWIVYWVQLSKYKKKLSERAMLFNS
jgi:hypothetical protein